MVHETFACSIIVLSFSNESIILLLFTCVLHESNSYKEHHILNHFDNCCNCPVDFEFNIGYQVKHPVAQHAQLILLYKVIVLFGIKVIKMELTKDRVSIVSLQMFLQFYQTSLNIHLSKHHQISAMSVFFR